MPCDIGHQLSVMLLSTTLCVLLPQVQCALLVQGHYRLHFDLRDPEEMHRASPTKKQWKTRVVRIKTCELPALFFARDPKPDGGSIPVAMRESTMYLTVCAAAWSYSVTSPLQSPLVVFHARVLPRSATHAACDARKCALIDKARACHGAVFPGHAPPAQCTPHAARATAPSSTKVRECPGAVFPGARAVLLFLMGAVDLSLHRPCTPRANACSLSTMALRVPRWSPRGAVRAANASAAGNFLQVKVLEDD
ncbi:hypothetical protein GGX14DRAFT_558823 [Mycena pura]|uniref:Secreted protein n=1 Tax=Mycena pura TaxID=153505 RepID=A0AAD6VVN1_9AGAR|nr:hypothetical protein GGX14DRAFT_558823 [Mycena pura]